MKKALITLAIGTMALTSFAGDGTVNFNNKAGSGTTAVDAPVTDENGNPATGSAYMAQLYGRPAGSGSFTAIGAAVAFNNVGQGTGPGYFSGGQRTITGLSEDGGLADLQVRAWKVSSGATWEAASIKGQSNTLSNFDTSNPNNEPPDTPRNLIGLQGFQIVPEPTTMALKKK